MATIQLEKETKLSKEEIKSKVEEIAKSLKEKYGVKGEWQGDNYSIKASGVDGKIVVEDGKIKVDIKLGILVSAFKGKIESALKETLDKEF